MEDIFKKFLKENEEKILKIAEENTIRNKDGHVCIASDDEWISEIEWEEEKY